MLNNTDVNGTDVWYRGTGDSMSSDEFAATAKPFAARGTASASWPWCSMTSSAAAPSAFEG